MFFYNNEVNTPWHAASHENEALENWKRLERFNSSTEPIQTKKAHGLSFKSIVKHLRLKA